uniref:Uncharacterized protein n=1 Tax=Setaria italica TaxID=4555 RepID=K3ZNN4_SETIT
MEGKRTTALMVIMCLAILSLNVNPATAAQCSCCVSARAKACCFACITAAYYLHHEDILYSISTAKLTHALMGFPYLNLTVAAKMEETAVLAKWKMLRTSLKHSMNAIHRHMLLCFKLWPSYVNVYLQ